MKVRLGAHSGVSALAIAIAISPFLALDSARADAAGGSGGAGYSGSATGGKGGDGGSGAGAAGGAGVNSPSSGGAGGTASHIDGGVGGDAPANSAGGGGGGGGGWNGNDSGSAGAGMSTIDVLSGGGYAGGAGGAGGNGGYINAVGGAEGGGGGGGGGGMGAVVTGSGASANSGEIIGGAGGKGGNNNTPSGLTAGSGAGGGGGGGGGGVAMTGGGSLTNSGAILGGDGGDGGNAGAGGGVFASGGTGGAGGFGAQFTAGGSLTNTGAVTGGAGGVGGTGSDPTAVFPVQGAGGIGVAGVNVTIVNSGAIEGGAGGQSQVDGVPNGDGGVGVSGSGLTIVDSGAISGGLGGFHGTTRADAIQFTGGSNSLTLMAGSSIAGNVVAYSAADALILGGDANSSFDVASIGAQYQNFGVFKKAGGSTWTLSGETSQVTNWTLGGGVLNVSKDGNLGASTGSITFDGGTLQFASAFDLASTRSITLGAGGGTIDTNGYNTTIGSAIGGSGSLTMTGDGTLTLSGANTYSGATTINGGVLKGGATDAFSAASAITVNAGGTLDLGGLAQAIDNVSLAGGALQNGSLTGAVSSTGGAIANIVGSPTLATTSGVTTLTGVNVFASITNAGTIVNNGTTTDDLNNSGTYTNNATQNAAVASNTGSITNLAGANWNGDIKVGANAAGGLITNQGTWSGTGQNDGGAIDNQATWIGAIVNTSGTFTNEGSVSGGVTNGGTFTNNAGATLDAANAIGGTLVDNGSILGATTVEAGATFGGSGSVGSLAALSGSTIAPGVASSYSTLTVKGAASFASGSTFVVNIDASGQNDKLTTTGATTISGGTVQVVGAPGTYSPTTAYTLISAQGGVSGTFSSLTTTSNLAFLSPVLVYDPNDVTLRFRAIGNFASVAQTPNQLAVANALQPLGFASPLYNAVVTQTAAGARQAFSALSGEIHASAMTAAFEDSRLPREAVLDRLASPYGDLSGSGANGFMASANPGAADLNRIWTTWGQAFGSSTHVSGNGNAAYLNDGLYGFIFGADATIDSEYRFGIAGAYTHSALSDPQRDASGRIDSTSIGLYGGVSEQALQLRAGGFYTFNHYNTTSNVVFPGFYGSDGAGYGGGLFQAFGEAGWRIRLPASYGAASWVEPFAGLLGAQLNTNSFAETGSAAALFGSGGNFGYGASTLGVRVQFALFDAMPLTFHTMLGWQYVFGAINPAATLAFASAPASAFTVYGAPLARNALAAELGADWRLAKTAVIGVYYSGLIGGGLNDNAVKGKLELAF